MAFANSAATIPGTMLVTRVIYRALSCSRRTSLRAFTAGLMARDTLPDRMTRLSAIDEMFTMCPLPAPASMATQMRCRTRLP